MVCVQRCESSSQAKGEDTPLYGKDESQDSVAKHDLRQSALAHLQDPEEKHTLRPAMSRTYWTAVKEKVPMKEVCRQCG
jgi:hypothetical protein